MCDCDVCGYVMVTFLVVCDCDDVWRLCDCHKRSGEVFVICVVGLALLVLTSV